MDDIANSNYAVPMKKKTVSRPALQFSSKHIHDVKKLDINLLATGAKQTFTYTKSYIRLFRVCSLVSAPLFLNVSITLAELCICLSHPVVSRISDINNIPVISQNQITLQLPLFHSQSTHFKQALNLQHSAALTGCLCAHICHHYP